MKSNKKLFYEFDCQKRGTHYFPIDNNIYFQDDITHDTISSLNKEIRLLGSELELTNGILNIGKTPIKGYRWGIVQRWTGASWQAWQLHWRSLENLESGS